MGCSSQALPLLSLPTLVLAGVVKCLNSIDKHSLARSCRKLAKAVSSASPDVLWEVTPETGWKGLRQILATETLVCNRLRLTGCARSLCDDKALKVLLTPEAVPGCLFRGIKKAIVKASPLPCILPPNLARILPDLESLSIEGTLDRDTIGWQPLPYCSSLRRLSVYDTNYEYSKLPYTNHAADDFRRQLPNITSLEIGRGYCKDDADTLLQAWSGQLTELKFEQYIDFDVLQKCSRLHSLTWYNSTSSKCLPPSLPLSMTKLTLLNQVQESMIGSILKYPSIRVITIDRFKESLQHDWSNYSCTWQKLQLKCIRMVDLAKLPLRSLRGEACLEVDALELPDPLLPNSLANVTYAAQCISNAGHTIEGCRYWSCALWGQGSEFDAALANVLRAASRVILPSSSCWIDTCASQYPETITSLIKWSSPCLREFQSQDEEAPPWFWSALQCCMKMQQVRFIFTEELCKWTDGFSKLVQMAAEHYVATSRRRINIAVYCWTRVEYELNNGTIQRLLGSGMPSSVSLQINRGVRGNTFVVSLEPKCVVTTSSPGGDTESHHHNIQDASTRRAVSNTLAANIQQQTDASTSQSDDLVDKCDNEKQPHCISQNGEDGEGWIQVKYKRRSAPLYKKDQAGLNSSVELHPNRYQMFA